MWEILLFFVPVSGIHIVLPAAALYLLLPQDQRCAACREETVPLRMGPLGRMCARLLRGRLHHRWCLACGWHGMTRSVPCARAPRGGHTHSDPYPQRRRGPS